MISKRARRVYFVVTAIGCVMGAICWLIIARQPTSGVDEKRGVGEQQGVAHIGQTVKTISEENNGDSVEQSKGPPITSITHDENNKDGSEHSKHPPIDAMTSKEKHSSYSVKELEKSMRNYVSNRDPAEFAKRAHIISNAAHSMNAYLAGKEPKDLSIGELKERFGSPTSQTPRSLIYRFDTGLGGFEWEFELSGNEIKRVIKRDLD